MTYTKDLEQILNTYGTIETDAIGFLIENPKLAKYVADAPNHINPIFSKSTLELMFSYNKFGLDCLCIIINHDLSTTEALLKEELLAEIWLDSIGEDTNYQLGIIECAINGLKHINSLGL